MPYIATRPRTIAGHRYARGEVVDTSTLSIEKVATLTRVGLLIQQDQAAMAAIESQQAAVAVEDEVVPDENLCPHCGAGPYRNLRLHISKAHEE